jgi:hypothetical protein
MKNPNDYTPGNYREEIETKYENGVKITTFQLFTVTRYCVYGNIFENIIYDTGTEEERKEATISDHDQIMQNLDNL